MELKFTGTPQEVKDEMSQFHNVFSSPGEIKFDGEKVVAATTRKPYEKAVEESKAEPKQEEETKKVEQEEPITLAQVRKIAGEWMKDNRDRKDEFVAMLKEKFNATKVPDIKEEQYQEFIDTLKDF